MLPLLFLALAEPQPQPELPPPAPPWADVEEEQPELLQVEHVTLKDDRYALHVGVTVSAGAVWIDRWIAAASLALDLRADFGQLELVLSPHAMVHVGRSDIAALFGFEGQAVIPLTELFAVSAGTEQVVTVSRYQTGAVRFGPSVRPLIARMGIHQISLQLTWLLLGFNERVWPTCEACNERPDPYYTLGYSVLF